MTDHDRARRCYRIACAMADVRAGKASARPWLARIAGYHPDYAARWPDDGWPAKAVQMLDDMETLHPLDWPGRWGA